MLYYSFWLWLPFIYTCTAMHGPHMDPWAFVKDLMGSKGRDTVTIRFTAARVPWATWHRNRATWRNTVHLFIVLPFSPLFQPTWLHAQDPPSISNLFTMLHCHGCAQTPCSPLKTLYLLCTFLRTKISCTCLYYPLFISYPK